MLKKILIANRGEIAVRIIKACQEMGVPSLAVYSEADRASLHVQLADEAVCLGPPPAVESYLDMDRIIKTAREAGADAIHPGYGFLAENAEFARRCEKENIVFIGPNSKALALVGDKVRSRQTMEKAGVPIIPGMKGLATDFSEFESEAKKIGYPVMIKASAGGGGRGMRIAHTELSLRNSYKTARQEAQTAFGDSSIYLEKYIEEPRHIEIQLICDVHGNYMALGEMVGTIQ